MTLPVALLIASTLDPLIAEDIQEIIESSSFLMEALSCRCTDHVRALCMVLPNSTCSSEMSSPRSSPTSDIGSEISSSSCSTKKSYSYFSDSSGIEEITYLENAEPKNKVELYKSLCLVVDILENIEARFNESYMFKKEQVQINPEKIRINYHGRDILDLGENLIQKFPLTQSRPEKVKYNEYWPKLGVNRRCPIKNCDFEYLLPLA